MKTKTKLILIIVCLGIIGLGYYFLFSKPDLAGNTVVDNTFGWKFPVTKFPIVGSNSNQITYSDIRKTGSIPKGFPVRLQIPVIGVDSAIEDALITPDGRMDVPAGTENVAWFALGPHPGDIGSAVIGGHFGIRNGIPFVFYNLDKLKIGDKVYIVNDKKETLAFQVKSIKLFNRNADATTVFTSDDGLAHLNLITCDGIWNAVNGNYPLRRVVFTDAIPSEGPVTVNIKSSAAIATKLPVTAITPSPPVLTPTKKIQASGTIENPPTSYQDFLSSVKNLYATPIDGLVTTLLMVLIIFITFKIITL